MKSRIVRVELQEAGRSLALGIALLILLMTLASCATTTEPTRVINIVPASQTVAIQPTAHGSALSVELTLTNTSANPIYYGSCAVVLEREIDGPVALSTSGFWQVVWSPICGLVATFPPPTLQPGESITIPVTAIVGTNIPAFDGLPGRYRARFSLATKVLGITRQLSAEESSSVPFNVVVN